MNKMGVRSKTIIRKGKTDHEPRLSIILSVWILLTPSVKLVRIIAKIISPSQSIFGFSDKVFPGSREYEKIISRIAIGILIRKRAFQSKYSNIKLAFEGSTPKISTASFGKKTMLD